MRTSTLFKHTWLLTCLIFFNAGLFSQTTITGASFENKCVFGGKTYPYIASTYDPTGDQRWCVTGGTINNTGSSCVSNIIGPMINVTWNSGITSGTISYYRPASSTTPLATFTVSVRAPYVSPSNSEYVYPYYPAGIPISVQLNGTDESICDSYVFYRWETSSDGVNFTTVPGGTGKDLLISGTFTQNLHVRRYVSFHSPGYNEVYMPVTLMMFPSQTPGAITPAGTTISHNTSPGTLSTAAATLPSSGAMCSAGNMQYLWESSTDRVSWTGVGNGLSITPGALSQTTWYRVRTQCGPMVRYSNIVPVYILTGGSIEPAARGIYYNTSPGALTETTPATGYDLCGSANYRWQSSTDGTNFYDIPNANGASYTPGNLTVTTYYRRAITCGAVTQYSNVSQIIVWPALLPGLISVSSTPVNFNEAPGATITGTLPTGGSCNSSYYYYWEKSADGTTWQEIGTSWGTTDKVNYTTGPLTARTWYRRVALCSSNEKAYSNAVLVNVNPPLDAGQIVPEYYEVPYNASPGSIAANPASGGCGSGYAYEWQQSTDGGTTYQTICSGATLTCAIGNITTTTFIRRKVTCGAGIAYTNVCKLIPGAGTGLNYIKERVITKPGITDLATANSLTDIKDAKQFTTFFDGLGRQVQTVAKQGAYPSGGTATDLVTMNMYDDYGRPVVLFQPFAASAGHGGENINPLQDAYTSGNTHYGGQGEQMFYSQVQYEPSPLNRSVKSLMPGNNWGGSNRGIETKYAFNTSNDDVKIWNVTDGGIGTFGSYSISGNYPAGRLFKVFTIDEQGNQVISFNDRSGKLILKKVQLTAAADNGAGANDAGWLSTYYLYDDVGNIRCVIQPRGVELLIQNNWAFNDVILNEQCFRYTYDQLNRLIVKKIPGAGELHVVYDSRNRQAFTQDAAMRNSGRWSATLYDELNRPVVSGLMYYNISRNDLQQLIINGTVAMENVVDGQPISGSPLPTGTPFTVMATTYYDNYNGISAHGAQYGSKDNSFDGDLDAPSGSTWPYPQAVTASAATKGMITGAKTKIMDVPGDQFLYKALFYDEEGRVVQTKSSNISGGNELDIETIQYEFTGQTLMTIQKQRLAGMNAQTTHVFTRFSYDELGRLVKTEKKVGNSLVNNGQLPATYTTTSELQYNALGQVKTKHLGRKKDADGNDAGAPVSSLSYAYNIRGWLLGINKEYLSTGNVTANWFGMELNYDKDGYATNNSKLHNGNIGSIIWRSQGDGVNRQYQYSYDRSGRLLQADFTQQENGSWSKATVNYDVKMGDGSDPNQAYDANGNIRRMQQWGFKVTGSTQIDDLDYNYYNNSNRLRAVYETGAGAMDHKLGDFTDGNPNSTDYGYDANGNMVTDLNKGLYGNVGANVAGAITYNFLNLPVTTVVKDVNNNEKGSITNVYNAAGNKLQKITVEKNVNVIHNNVSYSATVTTTTTYVGQQVYETKTYDVTELADLQYYDKLQFIGQQEGRVRILYNNAADADAPTGFAYDYFIKDHLNNVRMVLTDELKKDIYQAGMELADRDFEVKLFGEKINTTAVNKHSGFDSDNANSKVSAVNGSTPEGRVGPGVILKVMAGDKITAQTFAWYLPAEVNNTPDPALPSIVTNLLGQLTGGIAALGKGAAASQVTSGLLQPGMESFLQTQNASGGAPKAFLNWVLLDEKHFKVLKCGVTPVPQLNGTQQKVLLQANNGNEIDIPSNGYLYVFVSNESRGNVYFDNVRIEHAHGPLMEETHYYPFGLTMAGISSKALNFGSPENKYKYNGIEHNNDFDLNMYDAFYRNLDPQIGRFWQIDPKPNEVLSPYSSMGNNPISLNDPLGDTTYYYGANGQYYGRVLNEGSETVVVVDEKYDEQFQAYHDNNFKDFKGRKADDLVKEFGQYGVTYDAAAMGKYYDDNNGRTKAEKVDGKKIDDMKNTTFNGKPVSKQFLKSLNAEMLGNLVLKDGKVTVGTGRHSDKDLVKNSPGSLPYEEGKVGHIHDHPPMKPFSITWEGAFNATSGVSGSPGAGPSSADYSQSSGNTPYRNVVVDQKNIYFINGSQTVKHPR